MKTLQRVVLAMVLVLGLGAARAGWEENPVSGDASLDESMRQYGSSNTAEWLNPLSTTVATEVGSEPAPTSGDVLLMNAVSGYTRALLDRGGWDNPLMASTHYASGNALLGTDVGNGVTMIVATR